MQTTIKLIQVYYHVCDKYKEILRWEVQRFSQNNLKGEITDEEIITIYLFCVAYEEKYKIKSMYNHIKKYWLTWFPSLPSYQTFAARLNRLSEVFPLLVEELMKSLTLPADSLPVLLGDSMPVITCSHKRAGKVAPQLANKGYCATKRLHYYGIKIHALALRQPGSLPQPQYLAITPASVHDLSALRPVLEKAEASASILDKAYCDAPLAKLMSENNNQLITPLKYKQGLATSLQHFDEAEQNIFNTAVSKLRQPIESLFNWINEHTQIQNASKVRSEKGLLVHVFGRLAAALLVLSNF